MYRATLPIVLLVLSAQCHEKCPDMEPEPHLDMDKLLGHWFIVQKTDSHHPCLTLNFTKKTDEYRMIETCQSGKVVNVLGLQHEHHSKGKLSVPDPATPAVMDLTFTLSIRTYKLTIFSTDHDNYLAFLTCKKGFAFSNKPYVTIASRTPSLEPQYQEPIYAKLLKYNINPYVIDTVKQFECAEHGAKGMFVKAASGVVDTVKSAFGGIKSIFTPGKKDDATNDNQELDPKVTGEHEIDVRKGSSR